MNPSNTRSLPPIGQATPDDLNEALEHWEELDEVSLARLASHPESATKLSALRRVEEWMESGGLLDPSVGGPFSESITDSPAAGTCPPAEDLFDFARAQSSNEALEAHLEHCAECSELIASLASRPPSPLILASDEDGLTAENDQGEVRIGLRPLGRQSVWPPILAAAGLAGLALIPTLRSLSVWAPGDVFPTHALLRGEEAARLFPRGNLLASSPGGGIRFELPQVEGAQTYRIEVHAHGPSAFEQGDLVANLRAEIPELLAERLAPGLYSWRAFASIRGLESEIGNTEFQVIENAELSSQLTDSQGSRNLEAQLGLIHELVEQGFVSDARNLAQSLPESPERTEFLRGPGR
jgi:hypothetical protein